MDINKDLDTVSKEKVKSFVENLLKVEYRKIKDPCQDNLEYLNILQCAFMNKIPFQNLTYISEPPERRALQNFTESIDSVFSGTGGLCWTNNVSFFAVLKCLGFDVYLISGSFAVRNAHDHVATIAKDVVKSGDTYLVDVGFGYPGFSAVCLDFDKESVTFTHSFLTYKFIRNGDEFTRLHSRKCKNLDQVPQTDENWNYVYFFNLQPSSIGSVYDLMSKCFAEPDWFFKSNLRAVVYSDGKAVAMKNEERKVIILHEDDNKTLKVAAEYEDEQLKNANTIDHVAELFPMIPKATVANAVKHFAQIGN